MVEILILCILLFNYVIPFKGFVKLSENELNILTSYEHFKLTIDSSDSKELLASDSPENEDGTFNTMEVLGDLDTQKTDKSNGEYEDIDLKDML
jgi:hypothetical protein